MNMLARAAASAAVVVAISGATAGVAAAQPVMSPVGPGCADYAKQVPTGPGSVAGMATEPVTVMPLRPASSKFLARPKSVTLAVPVPGEPVRRMFAGLRSRWTML